MAARAAVAADAEHSGGAVAADAIASTVRDGVDEDDFLGSKDVAEDAVAAAAAAVADAIEGMLILMMVVEVKVSFPIATTTGG